MAECDPYRRPSTSAHRAEPLLRVMTDAVDRDVRAALRTLWQAENAREIAERFLDAEVGVLITRDGLRAFELSDKGGGQ